MAINFASEIRIDYLSSPLWNSRNIRLGILRLDEIHPLISGNKWFKLKENIVAAQSAGQTGLLTFGGAFSNHLIATAASAKHLGFSSVGMVRGLHFKDNLTKTLLECCRQDMELRFLNHADYSLKYNAEYLDNLKVEFPNFYIVPEGGNNREGLVGTGTIANFIPFDVDIVALAVGTGTTFSGLRNALNPEIKMLGFAPFKNGKFLKETIQINLHSATNNWQLCSDFHFGGFAKYKKPLIDFMNNFYKDFYIPLDFVYTGKMMFGIFENMKKSKIPDNTHLIVIHTGGLQGNCSIENLLEF